MTDDINADPDYGDEPPASCFSRVFLGRDGFACGGTPGHGGRHGYRLPWVTIEWNGEDSAQPALDASTAGMAAERGNLRGLLDDIGVLAANAPEDGDSFSVLEEIVMRVASAGIPEGL